MRPVLSIVALGLLATAPVIHASISVVRPVPYLQERPTFRASTDLIAMTVVVRKANGAPVTSLTRDDFELVDSGKTRPFSDFRADNAPINIGLLIDLSGSMDVAVKLPAAREVAGQIVRRLTADADQIGLFTFDSSLQVTEAMGPAPGRVMERLERLKPYGSTSLYDAIADTGREVAKHGGSHRAVVVLTDGADTTSRLSPAQVSSIASAMDVPVYVIVIVSPLDSSGSTRQDDRDGESRLVGRLADLARWTGGDIFAATNPASTSVAARQIVTELRHQYLIAFEPSQVPGWHPIDLRARDKGLVVRARSGYVIQSSPDRPFVF